MLNGAGGIAGSFIVRNSEAPTYTTAVWVSIGLVETLRVLEGGASCADRDRRSHILMILLVGALSVHFFFANKRGRLSGKKLEHTVSRGYPFLASYELLSWNADLCNRMASGSRIDVMIIRSDETTYELYPKEF